MDDSDDFDLEVSDLTFGGVSPVRVRKSRAPRPHTQSTPESKARYTFLKTKRLGD